MRIKKNQLVQGRDLKQPMHTLSEEGHVQLVEVDPNAMYCRTASALHYNPRPMMRSRWGAKEELKTVVWCDSMILV